MSNDVIREGFSQYFCESDKPSLASSSFHCFIILPVKICSIKVIFFHKICKFISTDSWISSCRGRKFSCSKCTHHNSDSSIIVFFLQCLLDFICTFTKRTLGSKVSLSISPKSSHISGTRTAHPKSKKNVVVLMRRSNSRDSKSFSDFVSIPIVRSINIDSPNRIAVGRRTIDFLLFRQKVKGICNSKDEK